jgi:hypothetical protein
MAQGISPDEIFDVYIINSLNAITLSGDPEGFYGIANIRTSDAGITWDYNELLFYGLSFSIDFRTYNEGWSASGYKFIYTSNRGETWGEVDTPDSSIVFDLQFLDARNGYAVGGNGSILKLDPSLVNVGNEILPPSTIILHQNYPNPFNPSTNIRFRISDFGFVNLSLYDVLGNEIATLINEELQAGEYAVEFNINSGTSFRLVRNLASGIYFYQLKFTGLDINPPNGKAGREIIQTKKMIYLK